MEYGHGGDIYTYKGMLDFSVNINPLGMSQKVTDAAKQAIDRCICYPDSRCRKLTEALAERTGLPQSCFLPGNGAADLIFSLVLAEQPKKALIPVPSFSEYEQALCTVGCQIQYYSLQAENQFRLDRNFTDCLTDDLDMVFLCCPSNPAGQIIQKEELTEIAERCMEKGIRLVLDECFVEFLSEPERYTMEQETKQFPCLFLLRAFTKMHAVPGLRIGYGITSDGELLRKMETVRQPWSVSVPAQEAGLAALREREREKQTRELVRKERTRMEKELQDAGIHVIPSEANFILMYTTTDLFSELKKRGILIRDCSNYRSLKKGWYRVAVRLPEENDRLLAAIREVMALDPAGAAPESPGSTEKSREVETWQNQS